MKVDSQLKDLEKQQRLLERRKSRLLEKRKALEGERLKLEKLVERSGYGTPAKLVEAINTHFEMGSRRGRKKGGAGRRKRTTITPELRDRMLADLKAGSKRADVAEKYGVSYVVVAKAEKGGYKKL